MGAKFPPGESYEDALKDGIILCKLMNKLKPGAIPKINTSGASFKLMENINLFQKATKEYGVADLDVFQTVDLWEQKDISQVTMTLFALGREVSLISNENYFLVLKSIFKIDIPSSRMDWTMAWTKTVWRKQAWLWRRNLGRWKNYHRTSSRSEQRRLTSWIKYGSWKKNHHRKMKNLLWQPDFFGILLQSFETIIC